MNKGAFVNKPFTNFHKLDEKAKDHQKTKYHHESMLAAEHLQNSVEKPKQNINNHYDDERKKSIWRNRHITNCVAEAILYCGCQCIALQGDREDYCPEGQDEDKGNTSGNIGNFLATLQMIANHDDVLQKYLYSTGLGNRNAKYTSPMIQNEVIEIIWQEIILHNLIGELKAAKDFSIMAE